MTRLRRLQLAWLGAALLALAAVADAADDPIRSALPPRSPKFARPAAGVLFADDFSSDSLAGWTTSRPGAWSVRRGMLRGDLPDAKQERAVIRAGRADWTNYAVDLDVCQMRGVDKGVAIRVDGNEGIGVDLRGPGYQDVLLQQGFRVLGKAPVVNGNAIWHHLRVEARGHVYRVFVDGELILQARDRRASSPTGGIALPAYTGGVGKCTVYYDNVVVTALSAWPGTAKESR